MTTATLDPKQQSEAETRFEWPLCYEAENFILSRIDAFTRQNSFARTLATRMRDETGTLILDWTDYLLLPALDEAELRATGYTEDPLADAPDTQKQFWHPEAMLPRDRSAEAAGEIKALTPDASFAPRLGQIVPLVHCSCSDAIKSRCKGERRSSRLSEHLSVGTGAYWRRFAPTILPPTSSRPSWRDPASTPH